jgi:putative peptide zinc metalloprotease protein
VTAEQLAETPDKPPEPAEPPRSTDLPGLADGVRLLGPYQGSGYRDERYLVERGDGQTIMLTRLLYVTATHIATQRDRQQAAEEISAELGKRLNPEALAYVIDTKLRPLGIVAAEDDSAVGPAQKSQQLLDLSMRSTLAPPRLVRGIARMFAPLFFPPVVVTVLVSLTVMDWWLFARWGIHPAMLQMINQPPLMLLVMALMVISLCFHECGHAAGCRYSGAQPGAIGAALYLFMPAFYTNVNDVYRLGRAGRLRTDLGGVYFNAIFAVLAAVGYRMTGFAPLALVVLFSHTEIFQQLLPVVRLDGYLILGDLVGVPNLAALIRPVLAHLLPGRRHHNSRAAALRPSARAAVTAWVLLIVPALLICQILLITRLPAIIGSLKRGEQAQFTAMTAALHTASLPHFLLACLSMVILALPFAGLTACAVRIIPMLVRALRKRLTRRQKTTERGPAQQTAPVSQPTARPHPQRILILGCTPQAGATTTARTLAQTLTTHDAHRVTTLDVARLARNTNRHLHHPQTPSATDTPWWQSDREHYLITQHRLLTQLEHHHDLVILHASPGNSPDSIRDLLPETGRLILVAPATDATHHITATLNWLAHTGHTGLAQHAVIAVIGTTLDAGQNPPPTHHTAIPIPWDPILELEENPRLDQLAPTTRQAFTNLAMAAQTSS